MLYGVGWIVATDTSITRFLVMTVALVVTVGLGYVRFVRSAATTPVANGTVGSSVEGLETIERRVRDLERRVNGAAQALGEKGDGLSNS